jgi:multicomponent Na+:H+ antiporter subunit A
VRRTEPVGTEALARSYPDGGGSNTVNVILSDFRALDTLGEITVVAAAVIGVMAFVRTAVRRSDPHGEPTADPVPTTPAADAPWARSILLDVGTELIFHTVFMFGLYLLLAGHNRPGGGFIAGLVIGAAFVVRFLAAGSVDERLVRIGPARLIGAGVALATAVATAPLLAGRPLFDALAAEVDLPLLGTLKLSTVLGFEIGVVAVVVGLVSAVLLGLGRSETGADLDDEATTLVNAR